ncbi:DUF4350 domain-containing protein [Nocardioides sp. ChNu-153]|uniref:DUF4350 domain-containing protein n=1 Tax=Nocardioides sp. ChNu-153 TaxID=2779364 RepID=UPI002659892F|nr:DUF4350 domain-containing protein [Nocardioides sp. ChNu-153]
MSAPVHPLPPAAPAAGGSGGPGPGRRRSLRTALVVGLALLALIVTAVALGRGQPTYSGRLDPDDATPTGGRALARVLADQGVDVVVARDADALADADVDDATTVLVSDPAALGERGARDLVDATAPGRLVVADPGPGAVDLLGLDVDPRWAGEAEDLAADCDRAAAEDLEADLDGLEIAVDSALALEDADGCFPTADGVLLAVEEGVVLLGADDLLTNDQVLRADNAAVALRLLGASDRLVWYVPDPDDLVGDQGVGLGAALPRWVVPAGWLLVAVVVALAWWRGRRFGALAVEPLPVTVRAIETTEGRGRLYRGARDRQHAAHALRSATRERLAAQLGASRRTDPHALVVEVAARSGRDVGAVGALLHPSAPVPDDDAGLVAFANLLTDLEKEVRRT